MLNCDQPALTYSLRGQLALELEIHGPHRDLHSGQYGGVVHDPLQVLCEIVAKLHNRRGRIAIPDFYDRVLDWSETERRYLAGTGRRTARFFAKPARLPSGAKKVTPFTNASRCVPRLR